MVTRNRNKRVGAHERVAVSIRRRVAEEPLRRSGFEPFLTDQRLGQSEDEETPMRRDIYWTPTTGIGDDHLRLVEHAVGSSAESVVIGRRDDHPFRVHYRIDCARHYRIQRVALALLGPDTRRSCSGATATASGSLARASRAGISTAASMSISRSPLHPDTPHSPGERDE